MKLQNRVALVTGGGRGIGRAICLAFAREGASVGVNYRTRNEEAEKAVKSITDMGRDAIALRADVSAPADVERMVGIMLTKYRRVDVLVNNAGMLSEVPVLDMPIETWEDTMRVFLNGTFLCAKFVLPGMMRQRYGKIINIAGTFGQYGGTPGYVHYATAKGGQIAFTKALAREVGHMNINVNAIAPGPVETELLFEETTAKWREAKIAELPLHRFATAEDIANAAVFLASEDSRMFTGQTLGPNCGDVML